jgi:energy-coupling factor transporter ATP-binding protein EcfA2
MKLSLDQLFDLSEQLELRWKGFARSDIAHRGQLVNDIADFVRVCAENGVFVPPGSADRRALRSILDHWSSRLRETGTDVRATPLLAEFDPKAGVVLEGPCPWPGLNVYTADQRASFFGRDNEIDQAVEHLEVPGNRILLIVGSSGSGKSSLALAGILPRLHDEHGDAWLFAPPFTPGAEPIMALAEVVAAAIRQPERASEIWRTLNEVPEQSLATLAAACEDRPLTLLIDQFEELLTLCRDPGEQGRFARILCALSDPGTVPGGFVTRILVTLRTDHLDRFARADSLSPLHRRLIGEHNWDQLSTIGFDQIRRAIKEPPDNAALRFVPPELVDRLASQTAGLANGLPLLQFALQRLWDTRPKNAEDRPLDLITQEMVDELPDVQGALGRVAEGLFRGYTEAQQRVCERLLLELVVLDENFEEPLRRRRSENELVDVLEHRGYAPDDIDKVIDDFVAHHLLRRFGEKPDSRLEVAHEALLRHWPHIHELLTGTGVKERLHLVKEIGREAAEWADRGTEDLLRLHGNRLERAIAYAGEGWLVDETTTRYIEACGKRDQLIREQRKRAETAERARRAFRIKAALAAFAGLVLAWVCAQYVYLPRQKIVNTLNSAAINQGSNHLRQRILFLLASLQQTEDWPWSLVIGSQQARKELKATLLRAPVFGGQFPAGLDPSGSKLAYLEYDQDHPAELFVQDLEDLAKGVKGKPLPVPLEDIFRAKMSRPPSVGFVSVEQTAPEVEHQAVVIAGAEPGQLLASIHGSEPQPASSEGLMTRDRFPPWADFGNGRLRYIKLDFKQGLIDGMTVQPTKASGVTEIHFVGLEKPYPIDWQPEERSARRIPVLADDCDFYAFMGLPEEQTSPFYPLLWFGEADGSAAPRTISVSLDQGSGAPVSVAIARGCGAVFVRAPRQLIALDLQGQRDLQKFKEYSLEIPEAISGFVPSSFPLASPPLAVAPFAGDKGWRGAWMIEDGVAVVDARVGTTDTLKPEPLLRDNDRPLPLLIGLEATASLSRLTMSRDGNFLMLMQQRSFVAKPDVRVFDLRVDLRQRQLETMKDADLREEACRVARFLGGSELKPEDLGGWLQAEDLPQPCPAESKEPGDQVSR